MGGMAFYSDVVSTYMTGGNYTAIKLVPIVTAHFFVVEVPVPRQEIER